MKEHALILICLIAFACTTSNAANEQQIAAAPSERNPAIVAAVFTDDIAQCPGLFPSGSWIVFDNSAQSLWLTRPDKKVTYALNDEAIRTWREHTNAMRALITRQYSGIRAQWGDKPLSPGLDTLPEAKNAAILHQQLRANGTPVEHPALAGLVSHLESFRTSLRRTLPLYSGVATTFDCAVPIKQPPYSVTLDDARGDRLFSSKPSDRDIAAWRNYAEKSLYEAFEIDLTTTKAPERGAKP